MDGSVIIESRIKRGGKRVLWVVTEVGYRAGDGGFYLDRPAVLSVEPEPIRRRLESVMWALMDAKGAYFEQVMDAVQDCEKEGAR